MSMITGVKQKLFPKGVRRALSNWNDRLFRRLTERKLADAIATLRIQPGAVICVHSMLSGLGFIVGGPDTVIRAILKAVPGCTIMMPSFPFSGSAREYIESGEVYDFRKSPSRSGLLTETFRRFPGTLRGLHPTHPCIALGPKAHQLIDGSEYSPTPFGDDSAYGRFSSMDDAVLLLLHTNNASIVHRIQEMVGMPNLFLDQPMEAKGYDVNGNMCRFQVKVHIPSVPLYVAMPGEGAQYQHVWFPDYALLLPEYNRTRILNSLRSDEARRMLLDRHARFIAENIYSTATVNGAEIVSVRVKQWDTVIATDVKDSINKYPDAYIFENAYNSIFANRS